MSKRLTPTWVPRAGMGALVAIVTVAAVALLGSLNGADSTSANPGTMQVAITGAPTAPVPFGGTFTITNVATSGLGPGETWGGWSSQVSYNTSVLTATAATNVEPSTGGLCPGGNWGAAQLSPTVVMGCFGQSKSTGGPMEQITFQCTGIGTSPLHLVTLAEDPIQGTTFFDESAVNIPTTLVDGPTITCVLPVTKANDDDDGTVLAGQTFNWFVNIPNPTGVSIPGQVVQDTVPAGFNINGFTSSNGAADGCTQAGQVITCSTVEIPPSPTGWILAVNVTADLSSAGASNQCNVVVVSTQANATAQNCVNVAPASVSVTKSADQPNYQAGDPISWTITVTSNGPSPAAGVVVTDTPTDGWTAGSISQVSGPTCTLTQPNIANCGTLNAGQTVVLQVSGTVNDPNPADNTCNNSVTVTTTNDGTASASAQATCLSKNVRMIKDLDGDPNTDDSLQNLWICLGPTCTTNGEGFLDVQELVLNVGGDADGVGAFEFQLKFDHKVFDITITPTNWLYSTGRVPGPAGIGGCAVTIIGENDIRFGCVSKDPDQQEPITPGPTTDGAAAIIHVTPEPDLVLRLTPGQDNGVVRPLLNENCELADVWGDPLGTGSYDALGREILLPGILPGGLVEDCADMVITVRMLEGDVDLDCDVDLDDDQIIAFRYGGSFGNLLYDPFFDLEPSLKDFDIDIKDVQKVFGRNGSTCQAPIPSNQTPQPAPPAGPNPGPNP